MLDSMNTVIEALKPEHITIARSLFQEYADSIGVDLCFQGFDKELDELPGKYSPPGGGLFLAFTDGSPMGCVAVRPLGTDGAAELKRLYVRPAARGKNLGYELTKTAIQRAREAGYSVIRLDTLLSMGDAKRLYRKLGFKEIPRYTYNPIPGAVYMELPL
jgi:ribosomal protein S18 acetylase RimI-like enzyme